MSRWIDAEWLCNELGDINMDIYTDEVKEYINSAPNIDIVRCKECENFVPMTHGCKRSPSVEPWWEDDFCSYGEREGE